MSAGGMPTSGFAPSAPLHTGPLRPLSAGVTPMSAGVMPTSGFESSSVDQIRQGFGHSEWGQSYGTDNRVENVGPAHVNHLSLQSMSRPPRYPQVDNRFSG